MWIELIWVKGQQVQPQGIPAGTSDLPSIYTLIIFVFKYLFIFLKIFILFLYILYIFILGIHIS